MKYNVTAYFCGHDHNAQHIHESNSTVEYFVTGAAHLTNPLETHRVSKAELIITEMRNYTFRAIYHLTLYYFTMES